MNKEPKPLKIGETEGDTIKITLDPNLHPAAYERKLHELVTRSGMTESEAKVWIMQNPIVLEIFYDIDRGLFAVESEATAYCEIYNPYTGLIVPNDNMEQHNPSPMQIIDRATSDLEDMTSALQIAENEGEFSLLQMGWLDEAKEKIQEAVTELHRFTDPEEKQE